MQRVLASGLVAVGLALLAPSCAEGNASSRSNVSDVAGDGDAAAPSEGCGSCAADEKCSAGVCTLLTTDADGDGVPLSRDCDDHDRAVHPGAVEICNGKDDNCDGKFDEGFDADGDGFPTCAALGKAADCDDKDPAVHPGAAEVCNGKDDNCDGKSDESFDKDNDGFYSCAHGTLAVDCDDTNALIHPGATESCNLKDDDCNGKIDDVPAKLMGSLIAPVDAHWRLAGMAVFSNLGAQLTQDVLNQAGGVWWNANPLGTAGATSDYTFDTFDMSATFLIQAKPSGADGLAFAWIAGNNLTALGTGPTQGVGGLPGYAVAIDTYQNPTEPAAPDLVLYDAANPVPALGRYQIPDVRDGANHRLRVTLDAGKVSIWLDGTNKLLNFALPVATPFAGHWGFTGGTGGASEAHWVTDVTMSFPNGQGCVP